MPYRRLPNTDQARIRAMKALLQKAAICDVYDLPVTLKTLTAVTNFLPKFEAAQLYYMECYSRQSKAALKHQSNVKTARLYVSHFIQVLDLAVVRSEIRASLKSLIMSAIFIKPMLGLALIHLVGSLTSSSLSSAAQTN